MSGHKEFHAADGIGPFVAAENANARWQDRARANMEKYQVAPKTYDAASPNASAPSIEEGRLVIQPELARQIVTVLKYAGQRPAYHHHVALLSSAMQRDKWTGGGQIAFGRLPDGTLHLVNGQHRLLAVAESGTSQEFQVLIVDVSGAAELGALYYRFDVAARNRSLPEILNAAGTAEQHGLSKTMTRVAFEAVALLENGLCRPNYQTDPVIARDIDMRFEASRPWWLHAVAFEHLIEPSRAAIRQRLRTQGVVAVALATLRYQPERAELFWRGLAEDDGLRKGDPRRTLNMALADRHLGPSSHHARVILPANAWNAWFQGRSIGHIKAPADSKPKVLGTPYDGRERGGQ